MDSNYSIDAAFERVSVDRVMGRLDECGLHDCFRTDDYDEQISGSDIRALDTLEREHVIDVKSIAGDLPTFCQELGNCHSMRVGWIAAPKRTTDYAYTYHIVEGCRSYWEGKRKMASGARVLHDEIILVDREKLISSLETRLGITLDEKTAMRLMNEAKSLHDVEGERGTAYFNIRGGHLEETTRYSHDRIYLTLSMSLREKPLNIVVPKYILKSLAQATIE